MLEDLLSRGAQRAKTILLLISTDKKHNAKHGLCIYYSLDRILTAGYKVRGCCTRYDYSYIPGTIDVIDESGI
jgi:hypothetical protein